MDWETLYTEIKKLNWLVLLILSLLSYFLMSASLTFGIILGGFIIMVNFHMFQHSIRRAFCPGGLGITGKISVIAKYYFRLIGLGIIFYALIRRGWVHPVGLAVGLSTVVISIISFAIKRALGASATEAT